MKYAPSLHHLSNGLPVLLDPMDIATTSMTVSVHTGARDELPLEYGITHFLEHMLCKGTARFPKTKALDDYVMDNGGSSNASTSAKLLRLYGRILAENFYVLADKFSDQLRNSLFDDQDVIRERKVILDEMRRTQDNPDKQFYYFCADHLFKDSGWAHNTLGDEESIKNFTAEQLKDYFLRNLSTKNTIIGVAGKMNPDQVLSDLEKLFSWIPDFDCPEKVPLVINPSIAHLSKPEQKNIRLRISTQDVWPWTLETRYQGFCTSIFEAVLSRRLFEEIREKQGLVYGVNLGSMGDEFVMVNNINTSCNVENLSAVVAAIARTCFDIMYRNPVTSEELARERIMRKFGDANWFESAEKRKGKLIGFYHSFKRVYDIKLDQELEQKITTDDIAKYTRDYFSNPLSFITMGPDFDIDLKSIWDENFK